MSLLSASLSAHAREGQFVGDLANLFRRYRVRTGSPAALQALAPQLEANSSLRSDLFTLCGAISRMCESDLTADELLELVAKAVGGTGEVAPGASIPSEFREVFSRGYREWQARIDALPELSLALPEEDETWRKANKFAAAANMQPRQTSPAPPVASAVHPPVRSDIAPQTPIGELTLSELRTYLDEIEQRVGRLQPYLESLRVAIPEPPAAPEEDRLFAAETDAVDQHPSAATGVPPEIPELAEAVGSNAAVELAAAEPALPAVPEVPQVEVEATPAEVTPEVLHITPDTTPVEPVEPKMPAPLRLRTHSAAQPPQPYVFRSLEQPEHTRGRGLLWVAAALALLAPAAYYGRRYVPASLLHIAPRPPAAVAPSSAPPELPASSPRPTASSEVPPPRRIPVRHSTSPNHLDPHAVHMAAEAARAEEQANQPDR